MQSPVYRNLDQPFQIFGLKVTELIFLCVIFVGGGEIAETMGVSRIWTFFITGIVALTLFWLHQLLGDLFSQRFIRFMGLPNHLTPHIFRQERKIEHFE